MKNKIFIILVMCILVLSMSACGQSMDTDSGADAQREEAENKGTYRQITYSFDENGNKVWYYANAKEEIREFSGYDDLSTYFYHDVTYGENDDGDYVLINIDGENVIEPGTYEYMDRVNEECFWVEAWSEEVEDDVCGLIDYEGNVLIPLEYKSLRHGKGGGFGGYPEEHFFVGESVRGEYVIFNDKGVEIVRSQEEISVQDVDIISPHKKDCSVALEYKGVVYRLRDGKEVVTLSSGEYFDGNLLINKKAGKITIYDQNLEIKEVVEDIGYIRQVDYSYDDIFNEYRVGIYAENVYYLTDELTLSEGPMAVEGSTQHVLKNGKEYRSEIDSEMGEVRIYNVDEELVCTVAYGEPINRVEVLGNNLVVRYGIGDWISVIDFETGEYVPMIAWEYNDKTGILLVNDHRSDKFTIFNENIALEVYGDDYELCGNGVWIYDKGAGKASFYDFNGIVQKEINGVELYVWYMADDHFAYMCKDGMVRIIDKEDGHISFEYEDEESSSYVGLWDDNNDDIGLIELEDGIYDYNGNKLVEIDKVD